MSNMTVLQMDAVLLDKTIERSPDFYHTIIKKAPCANKEQSLARHEKSLALEKLKQRRADTRRKIELGGLVIKARMDGFSKAVILGAMNYALKLIEQDEAYLQVFMSSGNVLFKT